MTTFKFGDKVTNVKWLKNEKHIVLNEGIRGGVTVASSRGEVQIVHHTYLTMLEEGVTPYPEKLPKTEEEFRIKLNNLQDSVDTLLARFPEPVKEETESVNVVGFHRVRIDSTHVDVNNNK